MYHCVKHELHLRRVELRISQTPDQRGRMRLQKEQLWVSGFYSGQLCQVEKEQRSVVVAVADQVVVASMVPWLLRARGRKEKGSAEALEQELNLV